MVRATEPVLFEDAEGQVRAPVRAMASDESVAAAEVAVRDEVFAKDPDGHDRLSRELIDGEHRPPVPPQQLAHWCPAADAAELLVLFLRQHRDSSSVVDEGDALALHAELLGQVVARQGVSEAMMGSGVRRRVLDPGARVGRGNHVDV
jgi:hypothetical protein